MTYAELRAAHAVALRVMSSAHDDLKRRVEAMRAKYGDAPAGTPDAWEQRCSGEEYAAVAAADDQFHAAAADVKRFRERMEALGEQADGIRADQARLKERHMGKLTSGVERGADERDRPAPGAPAPTERATVLRDERFADHTAVRSEAAREQTTYGDLRLGKFLRGLATGEWDGAEAEQRAMSEGVLGAGGYTVPTILSSRIIDKARNASAVFRAGAQTLPMRSNKENIARVTGDPTAAWRLENALISPSDMAFDQVSLTAQTMASLTVVSRELLEDSPNVNDQLENAMSAQAALTLDLAALRGSGTPPEPRGVRNTSGITIVSMGVNGLAITTWDQLIDTVYSLDDNNEGPANAIIYSSRTAKTIAKFKDSTGQPLAVPPALDGIRRIVTGQIPNNLVQGSSSNASDAYVGDWSDLIIGLRTRFQVRVLTERYAEFGQIAFLSWLRGDVAVAQPKSFAVLVGIIP